jgi:RNA polymerase sigma-70 factor (ECF subfamily)
LNGVLGGGGGGAFVGLGFESRVGIGLGAGIGGCGGGGTCLVVICPKAYTLQFRLRLRTLARFAPWGSAAANKIYAAVNLLSKQASTSVMAAGNTFDLMSMATPEDIAAQEFSSVAASYRPQIFRFLLASTRDVDLAETLTQDCLLKAHRNWAGFRGESNVMTWLMRIAINLQKDHWRNRRMQFWRRTQTNSVDVDLAGEWLPSGDGSAEQHMLAKERVAQVWKSVEGLSERQRTVFLLRFVEEQELSEIANATGLSEGTVKAHLSRAVARVRHELGGRR